MIGTLYPGPYETNMLVARIAEKKIPLFNRVRGPYCKIRTVFFSLRSIRYFFIPLKDEAQILRAVR